MTQASSGRKKGAKPNEKHGPAKRRASEKVVIGGWLSKADGDAFRAYASEIGIDSAALATLLLVRELNQPQMADILNEPLAVRKERRISARTAQVKLKARFAKHAAKYDVSSDGAASAVFRAELRERWLGKCVDPCWESG